MIKPYFLILFFLFTGLISGQNINNENLAREYYRQGEFKKASILFEDIYKKKKVKSIYSKYLECLIQIQSYKQAEKIIKENRLASVQLMNDNEEILEKYRMASQGIGASGQLSNCILNKYWV